MRIHLKQVCAHFRNSSICFVHLCMYELNSLVQFFGISVCTYKAIVHSIFVHIFSQSFANMCNSYMYVIARRQVFPPCFTFWHRVSDELFILTRCWLRMVRLWISFQTPELVGDNMARVTLLGGVLSRCRNLTAFLWKTAGASLSLSKRHSLDFQFLVSHSVTNISYFLMGPVVRSLKDCRSLFDSQEDIPWIWISWSRTVLQIYPVLVISPEVRSFILTLHLFLKTRPTVLLVLDVSCRDRSISKDPDQSDPSSVL